MAAYETGGGPPQTGTGTGGGPEAAITLTSTGATVGTPRGCTGSRNGLGSYRVSLTTPRARGTYVAAVTTHIAADFITTVNVSDISDTIKQIDTYNYNGGADVSRDVNLTFALWAIT